VRWISTVAFQTNLVDAHGGGEGTNNSEGAHTVGEGAAHG
jgi:hypothetical protein